MPFECSLQLSEMRPFSCSVSLFCCLALFLLSSWSSLNFTEEKEKEKEEKGTNEIRTKRLSGKSSYFVALFLSLLFFLAPFLSFFNLSFCDIEPNLFHPNHINEKSLTGNLARSDFSQPYQGNAAPGWEMHQLINTCIWKPPISN